MSIRFRTAEFNRRMDRTKLAGKEATGAELGKLGSLLVKYLSRMTPPHGRSPIVGETDRQQQLIGWKAVTRDIYRSMKPIEQMGIVKEPRHPKLAEQIRGYLKGAASKNKRKTKAATDSRRAIETILQRMGIRNLVAARASAGIHNAARVRGKVRKGHIPTLIMDAKSVETYAKEKRKSVGKAKAGWLEGAIKLGRKLPHWIATHSGIPGRVIDNRFAAKPSIRIENHVPWRNDFRIYAIRDAAEKALRHTVAKSERIIMAKMRAAHRR